MSWFSSFMHPGRGYDTAQKNLDQYYNQGQGYLNPYNTQGQDQYGNLNTAIGKLMDPASLQDEWIKNYQQSEASKNAQNQAQQQGLDAASSMGLMGSNTALNAIQGGTTQIGLDDRQRYLDDLMNKYTTGIGAAQGLYNTGAGAAGQMSQNAQNMGQNSAGLGYGRSAAGGNMFGNLVGLLGGNSLGQAFNGGWNTTGG